MLTLKVKLKHLDHKPKTSNRDHEDQNHQPRSLDWYHVESRTHEHQDHQPRTLDQNHEDQEHCEIEVLKGSRPSTKIIKLGSRGSKLWIANIKNIKYEHQDH